MNGLPVNYPYEFQRKEQGQSIVNLYQYRLFSLRVP